jgi:3D (Asp-Asp-Asp) domain-containing protein
VLVLLSVTGFVWAQKQVTVVIDGRASRVNTQANDVAGVLRQAHVSLAQGDVLTPREDTEVTDGMTVVVRHAIPVTVRIGDEATRIDVVGTTVADALMSAGSVISPDAEVTPAIDTKLTPGMVITAPQRFARIKTQDVVVPFKTETFTDSSLPRGTRQIIAPGASGLKIQVTKTIVSDGIEGVAELTAEKVVAKPVTQLEAVGPGVSPKGSSGAKIIPARRTAGSSKAATGRRIRLVSTAYSPNEPGGGGGRSTAMGHPAVFGVVAVDPRVIPLGSRVYVVGYGYAMAYDTGGDIKGDRIDLCFDSGRECEQWGVKSVTVIVLD